MPSVPISCAVFRPSGVFMPRMGGLRYYSQQHKCRETVKSLAEFRFRRPRSPRVKKGAAFFDTMNDMNVVTIPFDYSLRKAEVP